MGVQKDSTTKTKTDNYKDNIIIIATKDNTTKKQTIEL